MYDGGCGLETLAVTVDGDEDYEALISKAMGRVKTFIPEATLHRARGDCGGVGGLGAGEEWYVGCVHGEVSQGGTSVGLIVTFRRYKQDEF